jgi:hypothetical protein
MDSRQAKAGLSLVASWKPPPKDSLTEAYGIYNALYPLHRIEQMARTKAGPHSSVEKKKRNEELRRKATASESSPDETIHAYTKRTNNRCVLVAVGVCCSCYFVFT